MKRQHIIGCIVTVLACVGCRNHGNELMNPDTQQYTTPLEQFETIWNGLNNRYAFWDIDPTDWDSVYHVYKPIFEAMNDADTVPTSTLRQHYTDMCSRLIDHHLAMIIRNLKAGKHDTQAFAINVGRTEVQQRDYYHPAIGDSLIMRGLHNAATANGFTLDCRNATSNDVKISIIACKIGNIAYLHLSNAKLTAIMRSSDSTSVAVADAYKQFLAWTTDNNLRGIILDQRGNTGGYINDLNFLIAPFIEHDVTIGATRRKEGLGHYDYSVWIPFVLRPATDGRALDVPIVALADANSASLGETLTYAVTQLPNGCFIGERTFGGHGVLITDPEFNYAGIFGDQQLQKTDHYVYISTDAMRNAQGEIREGLGYNPTYEVLCDTAQINAGNDTQLNAAINYILKGSIK